MQDLEGAPLARVLAAQASTLSLGPSLWGFGGVHGGLTLALLSAAMRRKAPGLALQQVSAQFRRPLREPFAVETSDDGASRSVAWLSARAVVAGRAAVVANAVYVAAAGPGALRVAPPMPAAPPPIACPSFSVPSSLVPFATRTELRPVGPARPFRGGTQPQLLAWLRLTDDELPPDEERLIVLMDSLAPSYAAVLSTPVPIPTVAFSVTPGMGLAGAASPWILLRARTELAERAGWFVEQLDAWAPDGAHLGRGEQLRVVLGASARS